MRPRGDGFLRLVRWTAGLLVAILLATMSRRSEAASGRTSAEIRLADGTVRGQEPLGDRVGHGGPPTRAYTDIAARPHQSSSVWRAAEYGSTWHSRRRRGHFLRTQACSQVGGLMSCASIGRHRCAMACRRWLSTWLQRDMTRRGSWRTSITAPRKRDWLEATRITRIIRSASSRHSPDMSRWAADRRLIAGVHDRILPGEAYGALV